MPLEPGRFRFATLRRVGGGGLGEVFEIEVTESNSCHVVGTHLAIKKLNAKWSEHPTAKVRFEREIQALSSMRHPGIISFQGQNLPENERFYAMPLCQKSYRDLIVSAPVGYEWHSVARLGAGLAHALHYAHSLGYFHRDLKPENVLLDQLNNALISDWGLGYFVHKTSIVLDLTMGGMGTEYYCSAEQWLTGKCDASGDVYSLGVMLAELVRGKNRVAITPGSGIKEDVLANDTYGKRAFNDLIKKMTHYYAAYRPQSMDVVEAELLQLSQID